jgi:hypothetical protein
VNSSSCHFFRFGAGIAHNGGVIKNDDPCSINRHTKPIMTLATFMKHLAFEQNLHHFLIKPFNLYFIQQLNYIVDRIPVRHRKAEELFEVVLKLKIFTLLVIFVARTGFEYKHGETSGQMSRQFKWGCFLAWITEFTYPIKQLREMMDDDGGGGGGINLINQVGFFSF